MKTKVIIIATLLGCTFIPGGCSKNEFRQGGKLIKFSTWSQDSCTKTEYGGKDNDNTSNVEPIWWTAGSDKIKIVSDIAEVTSNPGRHDAVYNVIGYKDGDRSSAIVENSGNGLAWIDGQDDYRFWAVYPSSLSVGTSGEEMGKVTAAIEKEQAVVAHVYATTANSNASDWYTTTTEDGETTYTVYEPEMEYAYMTAYNIAKASNKTVELHFKPAFTAFEFTFESADTPIDLTEFRMESTSQAISGTFSGPADGSGFTSDEDYDRTDNGTVHVQNIDEIGTLEQGKSRSFTVFTLPTDLTDLSVYFKDEVGTRILKLNYSKDYPDAALAGKPIAFTGGRKYRIRGLKLPSNQWKFTVFNLSLPWDVDVETLDYTDSPIINAGALYRISGAAEWSRTAASFAGEAPIQEYFSVYAPTGGRWLITNSNPSAVTLAADDATVDGDGTLSGVINGRINLTITKGTSTGQGELNFYVEVDGYRYCINSEVTRGGAQVITNN